MRLFFLGLLLAQSAPAQTLAVTVMDAQGLSDEKVKRAHRAAVEQLRALSALPVPDVVDSTGPRRACAPPDGECQRQRAQALDAAVVIGLWLSATGTLATSCSDGWCRAPRAALGLDAVLPQWAKKGFGGLRPLDERLGATLKLDGRVLPRSSEVIALTAGAHQLDVLFPDGRAVLQRIEVAEGGRTRIDVAPTPAAATAGAGQPALSAARVLSHCAWLVGSATLLSAFIVAFAGRQTAVGYSPCRPDSRECVTYAQAAEQQRAAAGYAAIANVLLGAGVVLSLTGAGFFAFDVLR